MKSSLKDQFIQSSSADINNSNACLKYGIYKNEFKLEEFYLELSDAQLQPLSTGRWQELERTERKCVPSMYVL